MLYVYGLYILTRYKTSTPGSSSSSASVDDVDGFDSSEVENVS